jgi:hypothetical protein
MLYHYASLGYLKGLQQRLHALMAFIDPTLDLAKLQQRVNNGWPFLADFELSVATHIAKRAFEVYSITGANQCGRGLAEISLDWMIPDEQSDFESRFEQISLYAMNIDDTMDRSGQTTRWDDFSLTLRRHEDPEALAKAHLNDPRLTCDPLFSRSTAKPKLAPSLVARNAFTNRPCEWIYVEQIHGERDDLAMGPRSGMIIGVEGGSS